MKRMIPWLLTGALALTAMAAGAATGEVAGAGASAALTVQQILDRHVAARGGADAWRKIQSMGWTGRIESGAGGISKTPFLMLFRRPDATRFEVMAQGQRSVRVFDGSKGWKMIPTASGVPDVKEYSEEEIRFARDAVGLDGPLFDPKAKGVKVRLLGMDSVDGHRAYHLKVTLPSGQMRDEWIDAHSFLELRYDRESHTVAGATVVVSVYLRNYQAFEGLLIPLTIETGGASVQNTDKMIIEKIALNPEVNDSQFARPTIPVQRHTGVVVDTRPTGAAGPASKP